MISDCHKKKVFLSYAREDSKVAQKLCKDLENAGVAVWMDSKDILPGEKWKARIVRAIKESSYFLILLSSHSDKKRGFVQKELKIALELLDESPQFQIFIIPIRLDKFTPSDEKLQELQWIDLFPSYKDSLDKILNVITENNEKDEKQPLPPIIFGKKFFGRKKELSSVFSRLRNHESTAIVGVNGIGKTRLLYEINDKDTQNNYMGNDAQKLIVLLIDLSDIDLSFTQTEFWEEVLEQLQNITDSKVLITEMEKVKKSGYKRRILKKFLEYPRYEGKHLVFLINRFDRLLPHPNFDDPSFFALLRTLTTHQKLAIVATSRISLAHMNEIGQKLSKADSPYYAPSAYFNHFVEFWLPPFDEETVNELLNEADNMFSATDRSFIRRIAGSLPLLLQKMANTLQGISDRDQKLYAAEQFYESIAHYFNNLWTTLDDHSRITLLILSLVELGNRVLGDDFNYETDQMNKLGIYLRELAKWGLAEQIDENWKFHQQEYMLEWQKEKWTVGPQAFTWWIRDVVITETRHTKEYSEWIESNCHPKTNLITPKQWDKLVSMVHNTSKWGKMDIRTLARFLLDEL